MAKVTVIEIGIPGIQGPPGDANGVITPEMFGAVGDGVTDDAAAFLAFQAYAIANLSNDIAVLNGTPGKTYMVSDIYWSVDIKRLIFNGNGCKLKRHGSAGSVLLPSYGLSAGTTPGVYTPVVRSLIATTVVNATTITCLTAAEANNFTVGKMIMLASFDQQMAGQPPGIKYFEWAKVTAKNTGTGVVTLDRPIIYPHRQDYPYKSSFTAGDGRASIYGIEETHLWDIEHIYNDIEFVKFNSAIGYVFVQGRSVTFNRCKANYFLPSVLGKGVLNDCIQTDSGEIDKLVDHLEFNRCEFYGDLTSATSCKYLRAFGTKFYQGATLCAETEEFIDCFRGGSLFTSYGFTRRLSMQGGNTHALPNPSRLLGQSNNVILGTTTGVSWASGVLTLTPLTSSRLLFAAMCYVGQIIHAVEVDGTTAVWPTGVYGVVTSITGSDDTANIAIDFNAALAGTETLVILIEPPIVDIKSVSVAGVPTTQNHVVWRRSYKLDSTRLSSAFVVSSTPVLGRSTRVLIEVIRPYTGATGGNITLQARSSKPGASASRLSLFVDLKTAGRREASLTDYAGWTGAAGESVGAVLANGTFANTCISALSLVASTMASTSVDQLPIVSVQIDFEHPYLITSK